MKKCFLIVFLVLSWSVLYGQDIITLLDGRQIRARVIDISPDQIRYLEYDDPRGPIIYLGVSEVHKITYATGRTEFFSSAPLPSTDAPEKPVTETPVRETPTPVPQPAEPLPSTEAISHTVVDRTDVRDYRRPSITNVFINRGQPFSEEMIALVQSFDISEQFDVNPVENNVIAATSRGMNVSNIKNHLEQHVTPAIVDIWFPFDSRNNTRTIEVVAERGLYDATDVDVLYARASQRGEAILKDAGIHLLNRSYIAVYDFYNIKRIRNRNEVGYEGSCNVYLFRLDWNAATETLFFNQWDNPNASKEMRFSVQEVATIVRKSRLRNVKIVQKRSVFLQQPDEVLFARLAESLMHNASVYKAKENDDFRVKTGLVAARPLLAPIGTKEGVHVDQRYFAYELTQRSDGSIREVRRGVVRATNNIVDNSIMATGKTGNTEFYQTHGRNLEEGMLLEQRPEWGLCLSVFYGVVPTKHYSVLVETLIGVVLKSTDISERSKAYTRMNFYSNPSVSYVASGWGKDLYAARILTFTPSIGFSRASNPLFRSWGVEAGMSFSINVLHNVHIIGYGVGMYNRIVDDNYAAGLGLRIQY